MQQKDSSVVFRVLFIVGLLFLGAFLVGLIAIIPLVFSLQYNNALRSGDYLTAEAKKKKAIIGLIVAPLVGGLLVALLVAACLMFQFN